MRYDQNAIALLTCPAEPPNILSVAIAFVNLRRCRRVVEEGVYDHPEHGSPGHNPMGSGPSE